jgi:hypothetical protein
VTIEGLRKLQESAAERKRNLQDDELNTQCQLAMLCIMAEIAIQLKISNAREGSEVDREK